MRQLKGTEAEFLVACAGDFGCEPEIINGKAIWKPNASGIVELDRQNGQLCIKGSASAVRALLVVLSPLTREVLAGAARSRTEVSSSSGVSTKMRMPAAPSQAFKPINHTALQVSATMPSVGPTATPSTVAGSEPTPDAAPSGASTDTSTDASAGPPLDSSTDISTESFTQPTRTWKARCAFEAMPAPSGELGLIMGDVVQILDDPTSASGSERWVYGRIHNTERSGWFPFSHVVPVDL